jgi:hypothetical protein
MNGIRGHSYSRQQVGDWRHNKPEYTQIIDCKAHSRELVQVIVLVVGYGGGKPQEVAECGQFPTALITNQPRFGALMLSPAY